MYSSQGVHVFSIITNQNLEESHFFEYSDGPNQDSLSSFEYPDNLIAGMTGD